MKAYRNEKMEQIVKEVREGKENISNGEEMIYKVYSRIMDKEYSEFTLDNDVLFYKDEEIERLCKVLNEYGIKEMVTVSHCTSLIDWLVVFEENGWILAGMTKVQRKGWGDKIEEMNGIKLIRK